MALFSYTTENSNNFFKLFSSTEQLLERFSYGYNELSEFYLEVIDYGSLGEEIVDSLDYGSVANTATQFESYGFVYQKNTLVNGIVGKLTSTTKDSFVRAFEVKGFAFLFQGKSDVYINSSYIGYGIASNINGLLIEKNTESYVGTGRAFGFGSKAERVVCSYNNSSVVSFESLDYGIISSSEDETEDYGSILDDPNLPSERDNYGLITGRGLRPFGITRFSSATLEKNTEDYVGSGKLFNFGTAKIFVLPIHYGKGIIRIRGEYSDLKNTESYVGTGSLFAFSSTTEVVAAKPPVSGLFKISGHLIEKNTEDYVGSGKLFNFNTSLESNILSHIGTGSLKISGGYSNLKNTESYVGTGRAFGFGSRAERTAVSYNQSSVVDYEGLDYGIISSIEDETEDYGSILDDPNLPSERDDYGLITGRGLRPFGLTSFSGHLVEKNTENYVGSGKLFNFGNVKVFVLPKHIGRGIIRIRGEYSNLKNTESYVGTGSLFGFGSKVEAFGPKPPVSGLFKISGHLIEKNTEDYVGSGKLFNFGNVDESIKPSYIGTGSLKIGGEYSDLKNTESYVGTGSLFGFGSKAERTAISYNLSSTVDYEGLDYGSISSIEDQLEDYGSILDDPNLPSERDDYGLITGRGLRPFGLTSFSGHLVEKNTENYVGSGNLFNFGNAQTLDIQSYIGSGSLRIRGEYSNLRNTESYVGSGSLFALSSATEAFGPKPTASGLFRITGESKEVIHLKYVGSGSLFAFSSTTEVFVKNPSENIQLFRIFGTVTEKNTESYVGTGIAFGFGSKAERTTASYNQSSVVDYEGLDYGSISSIEDQLEDYGSILDDPNLPSERDDYGLIIGRGLRPFGLTSFSGHIIEKNTDHYTGKGSLFGFSSTTEAFGPKPPVSGLFRISGAATQSITPTSEIGSGSLFAFSSTTEAFGANPPENIQLFRFSGHLVEKNTESYVGTGSLFAFSSTTEAFGPKPPVSGLFRISGAATQSITPTAEIGSGSVIVSQASLILDAEDKSRLVAAYERVTFEETAEPQAIHLSGKVGIYFQFREEGSGTLKVRGRAIIRLKPIHIGGGCYFIRGSAAESTTPATEIGSGSVFTFVSKAETFGANPPENTALFKFSSSSIVRNTESYVGVGLERINVESLIIIKLRYPGSGSISISPKGIERKIHNYIGSGNLFGFGSASEYLTNAYKLDTFVIKIRGSAQDSHSESYVGSGSVFAFVSGVESKGSNPPENIALFKFGGSGRGRTQPVYAGKCNIKVSEGSGRPDQNNKTFIVSSEESGTFRTTEKPVQIKFLGSAISSRPTVYKGRGSIFGFGGTAESAVFSPDDTKELFKITGSATEKNTESYFGKGSIFSITGSSYSISSRPKETTSLFDINGSARESFAEGNYDGSGSIITNLQSKSSTSFKPKSTTVLFEFVGSSKERNTEAYNGSGSIGIFVSTAKSVFYDYTVSQKAFRIFGKTFESFAKSNYKGSSYSIITGLSENQKKNYVAPKRTRIFII